MPVRTGTEVQHTKVKRKLDHSVQANAGASEKVSKEDGSKQAKRRAINLAGCCEASICPFSC